MAFRTALSRRRRNIPAINNPTAGLRLTQDLSNTKKNYPNIGLLRLTQELGNTKKLPKHWVVTFDPGSD